MQLTSATRASWHVAAVDLVARVEPWRPPPQLAGTIDAAWSRASAANPALFDGTIFVLVDHAGDADRLTGRLAPIAFRDFHYWHQNGRPEWGFRDCFAGALIRTPDGAALVAEAAAGTLSAGQLCLIGGLIDATDVGVGGHIDSERAARRELAEETGLDAGALTRQPGFWLTALPGLLSIAVEYRADADAATLAAQMMTHARSADPPELSAIHAVRTSADLDRHAVHPYLRQLLAAVFARG